MSRKHYDDKSLYQIFRGHLSKIKKNNITVDVSYWNVTEYDRIDCLFFDCPCIETVIGLETWDVSNMNYTHTKDVTVSCSAANSLQNSLKEIL